MKLRDIKWLYDHDELGMQTARNFLGETFKKLVPLCSWVLMNSDGVENYMVWKYKSFDLVLVLKGKRYPVPKKKEKIF